ncbi:UDP-galactopyranose mutase (plasmid) [Deinococcus sp. KNUC1210]|uniref:UDP-galactopyranose mutase n=1 Tax=Deinococcus sp. KNUC1210 TaxID=2917691 RepID=UPI001EF07FF1|nr:UDP-galactopyranose mutase [Deinococcus sp. KNUC1210]ULH17067.1 UDP-galactopyranose mutase [Deinococcus sp. KNUC1210]
MSEVSSQLPDSRPGYDYLIVGAGFAGAVLAERLASTGQRVLIVDKRPHIGGNAYDRYDDAGILIHPYGPHIFHTNSKQVFDYLSRFTAWRPYQHRVLSSVDGQLLPIPINLDTVNRLYGLHLSASELEDYFASVAEPVTQIRTSEDVVVSRVGRDLYQKFFRGYTRKQWGLDPSELAASVTARVPTRANRDDRYFTDTYQAMPMHGYTRLFEAMLASPLISVMLNTDYRDIVSLLPWRHMIYTGPLDAYFDYRYGRLPYRSLQFDHVTHPVEQFQPVGTVNHPNDYAYTRVSEFKYLTGQRHPQTSVVYEYPVAEGDPYYPVPRAENAELAARYAADAVAEPRVTFVGRLATYRYYNMDQVVAQALKVFQDLQAEPDTADDRPVAVSTSAAVTSL